MDHIKSRNQFYNNIAKVIEEKTIKEKDKEKFESKVVKEVEHSKLYAPSNDTYIIESEGDPKSLNILLNSKSKIGDLVYIKKTNEPLITSIVLITEIKANGEVAFYIIDSFEPAVEIDDIDELLRGE
ncbi:hypothetical protein [Lysinibacillus antri]|uniref:Uncharacterized protein n=1 Tax=Lysinibacillus antri TaxID=2498145 RepID=A0A432LCQ6_9BACI|nr:hypothetical protein [Lysinibacillus antri]RUL53953.1 hypothetical protein EK386_07430 [Lysinibacillus antri]